MWHQCKKIILTLCALAMVNWDIPGYASPAGCSGDLHDAAIKSALVSDIDSRHKILVDHGTLPRLHPDAIDITITGSEPARNGKLCRAEFNLTRTGEKVATGVAIYRITPVPDNHETSLLAKLISHPEIQGGELQYTKLRIVEQRTLHSRITGLKNSVAEIDHQISQADQIANAFSEAFINDTSVAISASKMSLRYAGKKWIEVSGGSRDMLISLRVKNPADGTPIHSVIVDIDAYRAGNEIPLFTDARFIANLGFGLQPGGAVVKTLASMKMDNPFDDDAVKSMSSNDIHLVIRPTKVRYTQNTENVATKHPIEHLGALKLRVQELEEQISELAKAEHALGLSDLIGNR